MPTNDNSKFLIESGNKLMAIFEGAFVKETPYMIGTILTMHYPDKRHGLIILPMHELKYHCSYDWLMPIWFKYRDFKMPIELQAEHAEAKTSVATSICYEDLYTTFCILAKAIHYHYKNPNYEKY